MFVVGRILVAVSIGVPALLLTSCSRPVSRSELIGTWVATRDSMRFVPGGGRCEITLKADGTFVAMVPDRIILLPHEARWRLIRGKGQWSFPSPNYRDCVLLDFSEIDGRAERGIVDGTLLAEVHGDKLGLFFYIGEEGSDRFEFERAPAASSAPSTQNAPQH